MGLRVLGVQSLNGLGLEGSGLCKNSLPNPNHPERAAKRRTFGMQTAYDYASFTGIMPQVS